ncbi:MAG TPA: sulfotransferase family protein [Anaerolineae bacterium]|nr:sulfotransferase family protein [Anaerolineae bacterium]
MSDIAHPILVTGAHRSGTTWAGKMLAADLQTGYISEPLNPFHRPGIFRAEVAHWYQYICKDNEGLFIDALRETLEFDYHLLTEIRSIRSVKDFLRMGRDFAIFYNGLMRGQRALMKDPFAVFSANWFAQRLKCRVVVTVRHPAAFAGSLQRLGWSFDFKDLLDQPLLMRDHLEKYRDEMLSMKADDIIGQASLLWKMIYASVHTSRQLNPDLLTVRHEDLSRDPVNQYRDLYKILKLDFSSRVERFILNASSSENPKELSRRKTHSIKLDSAANVKNWRKRLSDEDVRRIREITGDVSRLYYSDEEW